MKYVVRSTILVLVMMLLASNIVYAQDYITDASQALQHASVYVAPGTEGIDHDTASKLQTRLSEDDNIVLIMLPSTAEKELGEDIYTIATKLSEKLGNKRIIGLSVGNKVVGYGPSLPSGVASDQMDRAQSVSNDPITALGTFAQNIHIWQAAHPQPTPTPTPSAESSSFNWLACIFPILIMCGVFIPILVILMRRNESTDELETYKTHFDVPNQVDSLLSEISRKRGLVEDRQLNDVLKQMCVDIEKYFQLSSKDKRRDAIFFRDHLTEVTQVLDKYIEIQGNQRYFNQPAEELRRGKDSILDFSKYVLDLIRNGTDAELLNFKVNTKILQAQRYR